MQAGNRSWVAALQSALAALVTVGVCGMLTTTGSAQLITGRTAPTQPARMGGTNSAVTNPVVIPIHPGSYLTPNGTFDFSQPIPQFAGQPANRIQIQSREAAPQPVVQQAVPTIPMDQQPSVGQGAGIIIGAPGGLVTPDGAVRSMMTNQGMDGAIVHRYGQPISSPRPANTIPTPAELKVRLANAEVVAGLPFQAGIPDRADETPLDPNAKSEVTISGRATRTAQKIPFDNFSRTMGMTFDASKDGTQVMNVGRNSLAARSGFMLGDEIQSVNGVAVETPADLTAIFTSIAPGATVKARVVRGGLPNDLMFTVPASVDARAGAATAAPGSGIELRTRGTAGPGSGLPGNGIRSQWNQSSPGNGPSR